MSNRPEIDLLYDANALLHEPNLYFDRLRAKGGIVWSVPMRRWIVVSEVIASEAFRNRNLLVQDQVLYYKKISRLSGVDFSAAIRLGAWIPFVQNGPQHRISREVFARVLTDIRDEYMEVLEDASRDLLSGMAGCAPANYTTEYAALIHAECLGRLLDIPRSTLRRLVSLVSSQTAFKFMSSVPEMIETNRKFGEALSLLDAATETDAARTLMTRIGRHLELAGLQDTGANRVGFLLGMFLLGIDSLTGTLSLGVGHMLDAAGGCLNRTDFENAAEIVDDFMRATSGVQLTLRVAAQDLQLGGQMIRRGEMVMIFLAAVNEADKDYVCPHALKRGSIQHYAFGAGRHLCTGNVLARGVVAATLSNMALFTPIREVPGRELSDNTTNRHHKHLPLALSPIS